jgi:hypothetical protein
LENYVILNKSIDGFIFLVGCVYHRSSGNIKTGVLDIVCWIADTIWALLLLFAYLHENNIQLCFDFDKLILNADLGFENKEFITSCVISGGVQKIS